MELTKVQWQLVEDHLPLVRHVVVQVSVGFPRHVDREELARAGVMGLIEAASRFRADTGLPFPRFAGRRIRGAMLDAIRALDWAPRTVRAGARAVESAQHRLNGELGRRPTPAEVAGDLHVSTDELAKLEERISRAVVLGLDEIVVNRHRGGPVAGRPPHVAGGRPVGRPRGARAVRLPVRCRCLPA